MNVVTRTLDATLGATLRAMDRYAISRRVALYLSLWITYDSYVWAKQFAETATTESMQIPAIIAAVLGAVSLMQGWILKLYIEGKEK